MQCNAPCVQQYTVQQRRRACMAAHGSCWWWWARQLVVVGSWWWWAACHQNRRARPRGGPSAGGCTRRSASQPRRPTRAQPTRRHAAAGRRRRRQGCSGRRRRRRAGSGRRRSRRPRPRPSRASARCLEPNAVTVDLLPLPTSHSLAGIPIEQERGCQHLSAAVRQGLAEGAEALKDGEDLLGLGPIGREVLPAQQHQLGALLHRRRHWKNDRTATHCLS